MQHYEVSSNYYYLCVIFEETKVYVAEPGTQRDWFRTLIQVTIIPSNAFCSCLIYFLFIFYMQNHKFSPDATPDV